jgi:hypothetical protein
MSDLFHMKSISNPVFNHTCNDKYLASYISSCSGKLYDCYVREDGKKKSLVKRFSSKEEDVEISDFLG